MPYTKLNLKAFKDALDKSAIKRGIILRAGLSRYCCISYLAKDVAELERLARIMVGDGGTLRSVTIAPDYAAVNFRLDDGSSLNIIADRGRVWVYRDLALFRAYDRVKKPVSRSDLRRNDALVADALDALQRAIDEMRENPTNAGYWGLSCEACLASRKCGERPLSERTQRRASAMQALAEDLCEQYEIYVEQRDA